MSGTTRINGATVLAGTVFMVAILVGVLFFAGIWTTGNTYIVSAYVSNARGIAADSTVFEAGLPVGLVTAVKRLGPDAILTLRIDHGVEPLPVDSRVELALRSLAGEADVLLYPGHSGQLVRNGGSLGLAQDESYTEVDQILSVLEPPTERRARQFLQGLGNGLTGEGANLNRTVGGFAALVNDSPPLTGTLAAQRQQVADIVQYFGSVMGAIGQRTDALREFAQGALTTFNAVAARDRELKSTLATLPYMTRAVAAGGKALGDNEPALTAMADHLASVVHDLGPTVDLLTPGAENGIKVVDALGSAAPSLRATLGELKRLEPSAAAALPAVHSLLCQVNPIVRFIAPYGQDIAAFFEDFGSAATPYWPAGGHPLLGSLSVMPSALFRGVTSQPSDQALSTLLNFGVFKKLGGSVGYRLLQRPGHRNDPTIGAGDDTAASFGKTHVYPHVTADCSR